MLLGFVESGRLRMVGNMSPLEMQDRYMKDDFGVVAALLDRLFHSALVKFGRILDTLQFILIVL